MQQLLRLTLAALILCATVIQFTHAGYKVGVGRADVTGPVAEVIFMGYAKPSQAGCGLHLRQFARAFVFDDGENRAVFVTIDACMMGHGVKREVIKNLQEKYGDTYNFDNVILSGTHTHGTPGGFLQDLMLDISILGFVKDTYQALIDGITQSIESAHENLVDANIYFNTVELDDANINRSPSSYLLNPEDERNRYKDNTDKTLVQIKFDYADNDTAMGAINWYAVHGTSMNNTNCLVSSDNVGYASLLLEESVNTGYLAGQGPFVAAFASSNLGDVSPNLKGPKCVNTGEDCDLVTSSCNGENKYCIAFGPGDDMFDSTRIIAERLFNKASELLNNATSPEVTGDLKFIHQFVYMPNQTAQVQLDNGTTINGKACLPAMGYSFAAGTIDGPGEFDFKQGTKSDNAFWNTVRDFVFPPTPEDVACQYPKPILINTGRIEYPYEWQPRTVATQLVLIGNIALIAVPGEFTTMSGRRMRESIQKAIIDNGGQENTTAVIVGLSNIYTNYIATYEEYQLQRYEGASTIYGPHTLSIYLEIYKNLATAMMKGNKLDAGPSPPDLSNGLLSLVSSVLFDTAGWWYNFGDCIQQPADNVKIGDTVSVKFISGHPRNNLRHGSTFLTVEQKQSDSTWKIVANDATWDTKFIWKRKNTIKGSSEVEIQWTVNQDKYEAGTYRIQHFGSYKYFFGGGIYEYSGTTREFEVK